MLDPAIFSWLPLHSADSTNCGRNSGRNGKAIDESFTNWQGATLTEWRIRRHNSVATWELNPSGIGFGTSRPTLFDLHDSPERTAS
jgi:hypothetical protein